MHKSDTWIVPFLFLGLWQVVSLFFDPVVLPGPVLVVESSYLRIGELLVHTAVTLGEALAGFFLGSFLGIVIAAAFVLYPRIERACYPYAIALKATPLYALAPLLVLWFGSGWLSKILMSALIAFFPVLVAATDGFKSVSGELLDYFTLLNASKFQIFWKLRLFSALPLVFPALKIASTLAVVGATIAEFTGASMGIGYLIVQSSYYLDTAFMFAAIISLSLCGVGFFLLLGVLQKRFSY